MKANIIFLAGLFTFVSCENEANVTAANEFTVIVERTADLACALPVIRFLDKGTEVKKKTKLETLTYNAYHLDNSLNSVGLRLIVKFDEVAGEDLRVCNTLGIGLPEIAIIHARLAE